jgi:hypothetical protein
MLPASYLSSNPSVMCLGPVAPTNHITAENQNERIRTLERYLSANKKLTKILKEGPTELEKKNTTTKQLAPSI